MSRNSSAVSRRRRGRLAEPPHTGDSCVSDLIAEISASTQEQSGGISQVSQAVGHLDTITQQNAALVEQSAAASAALKQQAAHLADAVGVFR